VNSIQHGMTFRGWLEFFLSRQPRAYEAVLRSRKSFNLEKILFLNVVRDQDVVFDVGANHGYYTLLFSHIVGRDGQVHAFEPVPATFNRLCESVTQAKRFSNIFFNNLAVADSDGIANLYMPNGDDGQASMKKHAAGSWEQPINIATFACRVIQLDAYIESLSLKRLDFVKCDVEGAELLVLKGMARTIERFAPILHLEICLDWTRDFQYSPIDIVRYLSMLGYSRFYLVTDSIKPLDEPYTDLSFESSVGSANLLCSIPLRHASRIDRLGAVYSSTKRPARRGSLEV
jgi:FkbM family methyltransferase